MKFIIFSATVLLSTTSISSSFEVIKHSVHANDELNKSSERKTLVLNAGEFDPLYEQLIHRSLVEKSDRQSPYGLVQIHANDSQGLANIESMGAQVLGYLPHDTYLVKWGAVERNQIMSSDMFRYTGDYSNAYKFNAGLWSQAKSLGINDAPQAVTIDLFGFPGVPVSRIEQTLMKVMADAVIESSRDLNNMPYVKLTLQGDVASNILQLANTVDVMWMTMHVQDKILNIDSVGPIQSNNPEITQATIWDKGLIGTGQVVAVVDSGLDRNQDFFSQYDTGSGAVTKKYTDASSPPVGEVGTINADHKVIAYYVQPGASAYDDDSQCGEDGTPSGFHGTHVTGTVAGDAGTPANSSAANYDEGDGMAPHAQILFQDIGNTQSGCLTAGSTRYEMHLQAAKSGASISSNSYGGDAENSSSEGYFFGDYQVDLASYELEDLLIVVSAGNSGIRALSHPGHAKNAVTVGALGHGDSTTAASFSSRGFAFDDRVKPDVMAPGVGIFSAEGNLDNSVPPAGVNNGITPKNGTSMATPTVSGGLALMRQYFTDGFYPSGAKNNDDQLEPSGSLLKSTLLNGTLLNSRAPSVDQGWGRIFLDNNLYFAGDSKALRVWDLPNADGLSTGESFSFEVNVPAGEAFRATLTWFDPPPLVQSGKALVNDLDLEVRFNGKVYMGNDLFGSVSQEGGSADTLNNVEQFHLPNPEPGIYEVVVKGSQVNGTSAGSQTQKQGFALVTSQGQCSSQVGAAPQITLTESSELRPVVNIDPLSNVTDYQIYKKPGGCDVPNSKFRFIGQASGSAGDISFTDFNTLPNEIYGYAVKAVDACGEGQFSSCLEIQSNAQCSLKPAFNTSSLNVKSTGYEGCSVNLAWEAGQNQCQAGSAVKYNIYRSLQADFQQSDNNRIAQGVSRLDYNDHTVENNQTYYYKVTAVDDIGNESFQVSSLSVFTTGDDFSSTGTYVDDPDSTTFATLRNPWRITSFRSTTGSQSFHNAEDGKRYLPNTCAYMTLPEIEIQAGQSTLTYDAAYNVEEYWDGVVVQISTNGGETWSDLPPDGGYPSDFRDTAPQGTPINACGFPATQGAFNGAQNTFAPFTTDLSAYAGESVIIRWGFSSDEASEEPGFYLDNIQIGNASAPGVCEVKTITKDTAGPWFNPDQSGHGFFLEISDGGTGNPERITGYWYAYLDGEPRWLLGTGLTNGNSATIDMLVTSGGISPPNFDPSAIEVTPWGDLTFDFSSPTEGLITWSSSIPGFGSGSMPIAKLANISDSPKACLSGSYSDPAQPGHGYVIEVIGATGAESVLMTWYSYDNDGNQIWLIGSGALNGTSATIPVSVFSGADFPPQFDPNDVMGQQWGVLELDFSVLNSLGVSWQADLPGYSDGQVTAAKLTELKGRSCF